jgi:hypothetical protein
VSTRICGTCARPPSGAAASFWGGTLSSHIGSEVRPIQHHVDGSLFYETTAGAWAEGTTALRRNVNRAYRRGVVSRINLMISAGSGERPDCFFSRSVRHLGEH